MSGMRIDNPEALGCHEQVAAPCASCRSASRNSYRRFTRRRRQRILLEEWRVQLRFIHYKYLLKGLLFDTEQVGIMSLSPEKTVQKN